MFQITKLAVKMTNTARKTVKNVANNKISLDNASDSFKKMANEAAEKTPFSKNIFKRALVWVKEFIHNFKDIKKSIKAPIQNLKQTLGKTFTQKNQKDTAKYIFENIKQNRHVEAFAKELKELQKAAK